MFFDRFADLTGSFNTSVSEQPSAVNTIEFAPTPAVKKHTPAFKPRMPLGGMSL